MTEHVSRPLFVIGHVRSGTTILHQLLAQACPNSVELTDDDGEGRPFWQAFGLTIGARRTGTYCHCASKADVTADHRSKVQAYVKARCGEAKKLINKNCHLSNKIGFVSEVLPCSQFVHIVREPMGVVASTKVGFNRANESNDSYPAFVHYWPETERPCWWTIRNDCAGPSMNLQTAKRVLRGLYAHAGLVKQTRPTAPFMAWRHARLSRFRQEYPDATRYYPGDGFARLPQAWIELNVGIMNDLRALEKGRAM